MTNAYQKQSAGLLKWQLPYGKKAKKVRLEKKLSQADVAKATGCPRTALLNLESNDRCVHPKYIKAVLEFLGVSKGPRDFIWDIKQPSAAFTRARSKIVDSQMALVDKIRETRMRLGLTQKDLAKACGSSTTVICYFENKRRSLNQKQFLKACEFLNISPSASGVTKDFLLAPRSQPKLQWEYMDVVGVKPSDVVPFAKVNADGSLTEYDDSIHNELVEKLDKLKNEDISAIASNWDDISSTCSAYKKLCPMKKAVFKEIIKHI